MKPMGARFTLFGNQNMSFEIVSKTLSTTRTYNVFIRLPFTDLNSVYQIVMDRSSPINAQPRYEIDYG